MNKPYSKAEHTRNFIIESSAVILNKKGFAGTSLSENPPLHLPIVKDAVLSFRNNRDKVSAEIATWEEVYRSTDHLKN
ncbi:hypothetical protein H7F33_13820 [Pedobacter sp. PAMC26386]|nr:hypothetical protein H7F33_13820 [Pedobacter sp. PAMC26386]